MSPSRYQAFIVPPVGTDARGVRVHFSGWSISFDETIPSIDICSRIRPLQRTSLYGPEGPQSEEEVRYLYNNRHRKNMVLAQHTAPVTVPASLDPSTVPPVAATANSSGNIHVMYVPGICLLLEIDLWLQCRSDSKNGIDGKNCQGRGTFTTDAVGTCPQSPAL
jgi:hypothetical protein